MGRLPAGLSSRQTRNDSTLTASEALNLTIKEEFFPCDARLDAYNHEPLSSLAGIGALSQAPDIGLALVVAFVDALRHAVWAIHPNLAKAFLD